MPCDEHKIEASLMSESVLAKSLSEETLNAIALNGATYFAARCDAEAHRPPSVKAQMSDQALAVDTATSALNREKLPSFAEPKTAREALLLGRRGG